MKHGELEGIADDLLHIEVLTFVVESIDPSLRRLDASGLAQLHAQLRSELDKTGTSISATASFGELSKAAEAREDEIGRRILQSSARVHEITGGPDSPRRVETLGPRERMELRRIVEVGTHRCAARTVISLAGDVTNHLHAEYVDNAPVLAAHQRAVTTAVSLWEDLAKTLASLLSGLARGILGK